MTVIAAADGSALGNPGPAGWGWYVDADTWASGGWPHGTNNMGELTAVLDLLQQTADSDADLLVYCDSTYVINSITKWMPGWKRKGWRKGDGKPVQNVEIMKALDAALQGRRVRFEWVKGHAGHELNEQADRLANAAALAFSTGGLPDPGPGFGAARRPDAHAGYAPTPKPAEPDDLFSTLDEPEPTDEEQVIELERSLLTDEVRGDPAAVAALLHPEWAEIGRSGRLWSREEMLDAIGPTGVATSLDVVSVSRVNTDAILLVWRAISDERNTLRSSLWLRDRGRWRQRFHQGTDES
ncbi:ribonuclease HI family protein [Microlunatus ginsengisoli]|uniref:Ribonuclease H n=1 Tax=Microlunatus ginsengisoli TaxID=363863 RepID=A0ABP7A182_9ACTN